MDPKVRTLEATHHPVVALDSSKVLCVLGRSAQANDLVQERILKEYARGHAKPCKCMVMAFSLDYAATSNLDSPLSPEALLAEFIPMDRGSINKALHHGDELGPDALATLLTIPFVLEGIKTNLHALRNAQGRSAFLASAKSLAKMTGVAPEIIAEMEELPYELFGALLRTLGPSDYRGAIDPELAAQVLRSVNMNPRRATPYWRTDAHHVRAKALADRLRDLDFAVQYLRTLMSNWFEIFVRTYAIVAGRGHPDLWAFD